jgi:hypothetical protein
MALLADKEQPLLRTVRLSRIPAPGAHLAGIVRIHLDTQASGQPCLVLQEGLQFCKGTLGGMPVDSALLLARLLTILPFGPLPDASQVFQADERMGMGIQDMAAYGVVGLLFQPSLSSGQLDAFPGRPTSAFLAQAFLQPRHMIGLLANLLSTIELAVILRRGHGCQIPLAHVNADYLPIGIWCWVWRLDSQSHQQIEALLALVIPQLRFANVCRLAQQGHMPPPALIGHHHPPGERQETDLLVYFQRVVMPKHVGHRWGDVVGRLVQAPEALLGQPGCSGFHISVPLRSQAPIGRPNLPENGAGHLGRDAKLASNLAIERRLQPPDVACFPMRERVGAYMVEGLSIRQLGRTQGGKLLWRRFQFQLGGQGYLHTEDYRIS